jgi:hypothetical protein
LQKYYKEDKEYEQNFFNQRETPRRMNIFIFRGLEWGYIRKLFEYVGYTLSSGTISLRHKVTLVDYNLSRFYS